MSRIHVPKRFVVGLAAASIAFSVAFGAAASLGLTVESLAGDQKAVLPCDPDGVTAAYTTVYNTTVGGYVVALVNLTLIDDACAGHDFKVTISGVDEFGDIVFLDEEIMNNQVIAYPDATPPVPGNLLGIEDARSLELDFDRLDPATEVLASLVVGIAVSIIQ